VFKSPLGHVISRERPLAGKPKRHPRMALPGAGALNSRPPPFLPACAPGLSVSADSDSHGVLGVGPQAPVLRIVGERATAGAQVVDQVRSLRRTSDRVYVALGEQDREGCQVRRDLVLADIGVLGPGGIGAGGAAVAVPAPVGRAAVRP
jgi:hypothetical protein